ncbi:MAG: hypothetical protein HDT23_03800 [Ruminococcus sp.]|nr:hypothetical protein [Ruminococcus sp.]
MYELVKINLSGYGGVPTVSGRELHEALEVETRYNDWFARMCEYGFVEGEDFYSFLSKSTGGRPGTDHALTIDTAKEICMLQRTETGRKIRRYFIETEKQYREQAGGYGDLLRQINELRERVELLEKPAKKQLPVKKSNAEYVLEKLTASGEQVFSKHRVLELCKPLKTAEVTPVLEELVRMGVISCQKITSNRGRQKEIIEMK